MTGGAAERLGRRVARLRELEGAASLAPGGVDSDFYHISTPEYDAYEAGWWELSAFIQGLEAPAGWLETARWAVENEGRFGEVELDRSATWEKNRRSLKSLLLSVILERLERRHIRPGDEGLWGDPRVSELLAGTEWRDAGGLATRNRLVQALHLLGEEGQPARAALPEKERALVEYLDETSAWFNPAALEVSGGADRIAVKLAFSESLPRGTRVGIEPWRRGDGEEMPLYGLNLYLDGNGPGVPPRVWTLSEGALVESGEGWARIGRRRGDGPPGDEDPGPFITARVDISRGEYDHHIPEYTRILHLLPHVAYFWGVAPVPGTPPASPPTYSE